MQLPHQVRMCKKWHYLYLLTQYVSENQREREREVREKRLFFGFYECKNRTVKGVIKENNKNDVLFGKKPTDFL